ncbi:MAG TPA: hypothetical protein VNZ53_27825 [Steroidobacteraceae bacterium]|jgi:hypothetical protein|nr:hypothetical protein [Steroidobacteraceae bacterium]
MILVERPPNFDQILKAFPDADKPGVIFAYGDFIYNPSGNAIPGPLFAHEAVHQQRQQGPGKMSPEIWWQLYIEDNAFRYREELLAHVAEYKAQTHGLDRNQKHKLLMSTAARLTAPLYNYVPPRSLTQAIYDLKWEIDR